jgi:hypothetical protein
LYDRTRSSQAANVSIGRSFLVDDVTDRLKMSTPRLSAASSLLTKSVSSALPAVLKMFAT